MHRIDFLLKSIFPLVTWAVAREPVVGTLGVWDTSRVRLCLRRDRAEAQ
jgi:hypothetical protein